MGFEWWYSLQVDRNCVPRLPMRLQCIASQGLSQPSLPWLQWRPVSLTLRLKSALLARLLRRAALFLSQLLTLRWLGGVYIHDFTSSVHHQGISRFVWPEYFDILPYILSNIYSDILSGIFFRQSICHPGFLCAFGILSDVYYLAFYLVFYLKF